MRRWRRGRVLDASPGERSWSWSRSHPASAVPAPAIITAAPQALIQAGRHPRRPLPRLRPHRVRVRRGRCPTSARVRWAKDLRLDPSDKRGPCAGQRLHPGAASERRIAHELEPPQESTFGPARRAFDCPTSRMSCCSGTSKADGRRRHRAHEADAGSCVPSSCASPAASSSTWRPTSPRARSRSSSSTSRPHRRPAAVRRARSRARCPRAAGPRAPCSGSTPAPPQAELDAGLRFMASGTRGFRDLLGQRPRRRPRDGARALQLGWCGRWHRCRARSCPRCDHARLSTGSRSTTAPARPRSRGAGATRSRAASSRSRARDPA